MRKLITAVTLAAALAIPAGASAFTQAQARAAAGVYINNHCAEAGYACEWWVIHTVTYTGINETGRAQWKVGASSSEARNVNNPFLPKYLGCTWYVGVGPEGGIINPVKACSPEA